jgi:hypothetical protein
LFKVLLKASEQRIALFKHAGLRTGRDPGRARSCPAVFWLAAASREAVLAVKKNKDSVCHLLLKSFYLE